MRGTGDEDHSLRRQFVIELDDNTWAMFYVARSSTKREGIKYATAPKSDPNNWTKQNGDGEYVIESGAGTWDLSLNIKKWVKSSNR